MCCKLCEFIQASKDVLFSCVYLCGNVGVVAAVSIDEVGVDVVTTGHGR